MHPISASPRARHGATLVTLILCTPILLILSADASNAQSIRRSVGPRDSLLMAAIQLIDNGRHSEARTVLEEGMERYPEDSSFPYELAYIHYQLKEYREARELLEELVTRTDANDRYYQLLGNARDLTGDHDGAIAAYDAGLERFPESGPLHLERGIMAAGAEQYGEAMAYWERGIVAAPDFPSNYYHVARIYLQTTERGWGMLYGEIFLNLEPGSPRSASTRARLYEGWNDAITAESEGTDLANGKEVHAINLFEKLVVELDTATNEAQMPFTFFLFRSFVLAAMPTITGGNGTMSVADLHALRTRFVEHWFSDTATARAFDIELFDRWRRLQKAGLFEAYNHALFYCDSTKAEVEAYAEKNARAMRDVMQWMSDNPIGADRKRAFSRFTLKPLPMPKEKADDMSKMTVPME